MLLPANGALRDSRATAQNNNQPFFTVIAMLTNTTKRANQNRAPQDYFAVTNTTPAEHDVWDDASVNLLLRYKNRCQCVKPRLVQTAASTSRALAPLRGMAIAA